MQQQGGRPCADAAKRLWTSATARAVESLDGQVGGRCWVTTRSGARHLIDLDAGTATRFGAAGREWDGAGMGLGPVTPDGKAFRCCAPPTVRVGERVYLTNSLDWRLTSEVVSIEAASEAAGAGP